MASSLRTTFTEGHVSRFYASLGSILFSTLKQSRFSSAFLGSFPFLLSCHYAPPSSSTFILFGIVFLRDVLSSEKFLLLLLICFASIFAS